MSCLKSAAIEVNGRCVSIAIKTIHPQCPTIQVQNPHVLRNFEAVPNKQAAVDGCRSRRTVSIQNFPSIGIECATIEDKTIASSTSVSRREQIRAARGSDITSVETEGAASRNNKACYAIGSTGSRATCDGIVAGSDFESASRSVHARETHRRVAL